MTCENPLFPIAFIGLWTLMLAADGTRVRFVGEDLVGKGRHSSAYVTMVRPEQLLLHTIQAQCVEV